MLASGPGSLLARAVAVSLLFVGCTGSPDHTDDSTPNATRVQFGSGPTVGLELPAMFDRAVLAFHPDDGGYTSAWRTHRATIRGGAVDLTPYTYEDGERTAQAPMTIETAAISIGQSPLSSVASSTSISNGTVEVQRGDTVERLRNDVDGLHQEWKFASSPGTGDLVVEVAVSGYTYATATSGGLHFTGSSGMVRYSNAVWTDAAGQAWPVTASFDASTDRI